MIVADLGSNWKQAYKICHQIWEKLASMYVQ